MAFHCGPTFLKPMLPPSTPVPSAPPGPQQGPGLNLGQEQPALRGHEHCGQHLHRRPQPLGARHAPGERRPPRPQSQPASSRAWLRVCGFTQVKPGGKVGAAHLQVLVNCSPGHLLRPRPGPGAAALTSPRGCHTGATSGRGQGRCSSLHSS